jgi:hypothetical protein
MTETIPRHGAVLIMDDICPVFIKLAKRLNQLAGMTPSNGFSTITVTIIIVDGEPILWMRPEVNTLATSEPKGKADEFLDKLKNVRK